MEPKLLPAVLLSTLSLICLVVVMRGLQLALGKTTIDPLRQKKIIINTYIVVAIWLLLVGSLSLNGFFSDFSQLPPRPLWVILLPALVFTRIAFSKTAGELLLAIPPHWLVAMQAFRILVEILLWKAFMLNLLPIQMTFEGSNFDGLSGLLAVPVAMILSKKWAPKLLLAFNIIGLLLLLNIFVIAVLSMPTPIRYFMNEPPNTLIGEFPFIYLGAVLVAIAQGLHIFSLRQWWLLRKRDAMLQEQE